MSIFCARSRAHRAPCALPEQVIRELDEAVARAMGDAGEPGPVYMEIPTDVLRTHVPPQLVLDEWIAAKPPRLFPPDPHAVAEAVEVFWRRQASAGHYRPRRARGGGRARAPARRHRRALSRYPGKPRPGAGRSSLVVRRRCGPRR